VDDEEIVRKVASAALKGAGFCILAATNGAEALDVLRSHPEISLVILDLTMPVMNGEQAIPLIKALRPDLPIILSSGYSEAELSRRFVSSGISGFLQKPYTISAILSKVRRNLEILASKT
jgi:two-component system cell cycle sensor histidine kinase/response regulator CckA